MNVFKNLEQALKTEAKRDLAKFKRELKATSKEEILSTWYYKNLMTPAFKRDAPTMAKVHIVNRLIARKVSAMDNTLSNKLERLKTVSQSNLVESITISVEWVKNRTWGNCPKAEITVDYTNNTREHFTASRATGCGYDKESQTVSNALNQCNGLLKALYTQKNRVSKFKQSNSTAIGYGSGYGILPYFEGGVGVDCLYEICKSIGFKFERVTHGKTFDVYKITKK